MALEEEIKKQKAKNRILKNDGKPQKVYNLVKDYNENNDKPKGQATCICKRCKKEFEQDYVPDRNAYTDWKTCKNCREILKEKKTKAVMKNEKEVSVAKLPYTPYNWQIEAGKAFEDHRFIVLACGNRSGKDRFTIMAGIKYFIECLNENRALDNLDMVPPVLWWQLAPTEKMAKQNWRELKQYFPKEWIVACSDSSYQMETIGGGIIEVRSGYDPDSLVGVGLDLVTITEAARFKDLSLAWANLEARLNSPGRGRVKDRAGRKFGQGKAIINSSPLGKNDFYDMFCFGQKDHPNYSSLWWSAKYPWTCNPVNAELASSIVKTKYGELTYEETLRRQIGEQTFRSNYLADFLAEDGTVFKDFEEKCVVNIFDPELQLNTKAKRDEFISNWQKVEPGAHYCAGYDPSPGTTGDSPTFAIRNIDNNRVIRIFDLMGKSYEQQWDFITDICKQYNFAPVYWLRTGHTPIEGQFEKRGLTEVPIDEQGTNKQKLVQNLEIAVENRDLQLLMDGSNAAQTLIYQMNDYVGTKTKTGNIQYSNDKQKHDDFVSCLYAAFSDYSAFETKIGYCGLFGAL